MLILFVNKDTSCTLLLVCFVSCIICFLLDKSGQILATDVVEVTLPENNQLFNDDGMFSHYYLLTQEIILQCVRR